ncbi:MAG: HAD family hydrolase [Sedimentisphaerales bacterium]|nr:HAD family hydrolase [Sedimentisphaerales bacterium]
MKNRAIFLDRDDTLIEDPGYINHPSQVKLLPHVCEALIDLRQMGYKLVIVTNQSAVARGIVTEDGLEEIHQRLIGLLRHEGASIDRIYYCPYHPNGIIPEYRKDSDLRKPNPGMLLSAAQEMEIDLEASWMLGNSYRDIAAGMRAGCKTILITSAEKPAQRTATDPIPFKKAVNIREAVNIVKTYDQHSRFVETASEQEIQLPEPEAEPIAVSAGPDMEQNRFQRNHERRRGLGLMIPDTPIISRESQPFETAAFVEEESNQQEPSETVQGDRIEQLLEEMVRHLKGMHRESMFHEFSILKALAGVVQVIVIFCLVWSLWFLLDPQARISSVHTLIGYAAVLQLMVIAFYMMRDRK